MREDRLIWSIVSYMIKCIFIVNLKKRMWISSRVLTDKEIKIICFYKWKYLLD